MRHRVPSILTAVIVGMSAPACAGSRAQTLGGHGPGAAAPARAAVGPSTTATGSSASATPASGPAGSSPTSTTGPVGSPPTAAPQTAGPTVAGPTTAVAPTAVAPTAVAPTAFVGTVAHLGAADLPSSWRTGCPLGPDGLRMLHLSYWGFDGKPHVGTMVVNAAVTGDVVKIFSILYGQRFPIHQMQPVDAYQGSDPASMAADNTSGFNCRSAVAPGPPQWSSHAYGEAIDVNPVENPYLEAGTVMPPGGAAYLDRSDVRPGMAVPGGQLVQAFAAAGWFWGGRWTGAADYQHFSKTGG